MKKMSLRDTSSSSQGLPISVSGFEKALSCCYFEGRSWKKFTPLWLLTPSLSIIATERTHHFIPWHWLLALDYNYAPKSHLVLGMIYAELLCIWKAITAFYSSVMDGNYTSERHLKKISPLWFCLSITDPLKVGTPPPHCRPHHILPVLPSVAVDLRACGQGFHPAPPLCAAAAALCWWLLCRQETK